MKSNVPFIPLVESQLIQIKTLKERKTNKEQTGQNENSRKMVDLNRINKHIKCKWSKYPN